MNGREREIDRKKMMTREKEVECEKGGERLRE